MTKKEKTSMVKRDNYVVIQGWMLSELNLKGNELILYAVIYGFSQAENQTFSGSLQYLADWTNSTKQGVMKSLKSLESKGFIVKKDTYINKVKFCEYYATKFNGVVNKVDGGMQQSLMGGSKQSSTNNKELYNLEDNLDDKDNDKNDKLDKLDKLGESDDSTIVEIENENFKKDKEKIDNHNKMVAETYLKPTALTKMLIKNGYIAKDDPYITEYNEFLIELTHDYDFKQVRDCIGYFFSMIKNRREEIIERLPYFKQAMLANLERVNTDWDLIFKLAGGQ